MRIGAILIASTLVLAACGSHVTPAVERSPDVASPSPARSETPTATVAPTATPEPRLYDKLRVFVASESNDQVWVLEGAPGAAFSVVGKIAVGRLPHQMAVSPDGRYVAVNNRMSNTTSIIDPVAMKEIIRIPVGKQPHAITFSFDGAALFVGHERDNYLLRIETGTWKTTPIMTGVPQHVFTINPLKPSELWFSVTNSTESDALRVVDLGTKQITRIPIGDVHDMYFVPDGSEVWSSSSGFLDKPSDRMVVYDPVAKKVKREFRLTGRYPFHTHKPFQDGMYRLEPSNVMLLSDHIGPSLLWVDWRERLVLGETKLGGHPFHTTYDPEGGRLLVTTNVDGMVNVVDAKTRSVLHKVPVTKAHGIVSVGIRNN